MDLRGLGSIAAWGAWYMGRTPSFSVCSTPQTFCFRNALFLLFTVSLHTHPLSIQGPQQWMGSWWHRAALCWGSVWGPALTELLSLTFALLSPLGNKSAFLQEEATPSLLLPGRLDLFLSLKDSWGRPRFLCSDLRTYRGPALLAPQAFVSWIPSNSSLHMKPGQSCSNTGDRNTWGRFLNPTALEKSIWQPLPPNPWADQPDPNWIWGWCREQHGSWGWEPAPRCWPEAHRVCLFENKPEPHFRWPNAEKPLIVPFPQSMAFSLGHRCVVFGPEEAKHRKASEGEQWTWPGANEHDLELLTPSSPASTWWMSRFRVICSGQWPLNLFYWPV